MTTTRGAIDLTLKATELPTPAALTSDDESFLIERGRQQLDMSVGAVVRSQTLRMSLASALEARLLHVRRSRLDAFGLVADPAMVTFEQLAVLQRPHNGTVGQAFELAVADACRAGDLEVVEPIREALKLLNIGPPVSLDMVVLGLEKVRPEEAEGFYAEFNRWLPDDGVLRTGTPGRPAKMSTAVQRLSQATWASMDNPKRGVSVNTSQLGRADALVVADNSAVAVSMKINPRAVLNREAWKDVPLWITTGRHVDDSESVKIDTRWSVPKVVVRLNQDRWAHSFARSLWVLDSAAARADGAHLPPYWDYWSGSAYNEQAHADSLVNWMVKNKHLTLKEICWQLRNIEVGAQEILLPALQAKQVTATVEVLNSTAVTDAFKKDADNGSVVIGQKHLFFGAARPGLAA